MVLCAVLSAALTGAVIVFIKAITSIVYEETCVNWFQRFCSADSFFC